ncbi:hypothetical protein SY83_07660 [Paenibacillus swuensis]|uniref:Right handed beta helix domain-containing protein n=1 Tax=Paenibacillus swuensis TaxID=1178515 RepID=A0A172TGU1_9BACL|nr:carbohydrate binding domain-containing protein [Paenibacillus swuensis]ANE46166.1 hypothetical protein SY83_07660 [Paenibacillus swuensis]
MIKQTVSVLLMLALILTGLNLAPNKGYAASSYYVSTTGSNSNPGTLAQPFATINKFMEVAEPGDTVYVRGGTYAMGETYLSKSGSAGNYITIRNYPGELPVLDGGGTAGVAFYYGENEQGAGKGQYVIIDGFVIQNYWRSAINIGWTTPARRPSDNREISPYKTVSNVIIRNNVVDRHGQNGITVMNASDITIERNIVGRTGYNPDTGSWSSGINLWGMYGNNNLVKNNVTYHNIDVSAAHTDGNGIIVDLSFYNGGVRIENNIAFENGGAGIIMTESSYGTIINNTLYDNGKEPNYVNGGTGLGFYGHDAVDNAVVKNNLVYQSFGSGLYHSNPFTNSTFQNNNISGQSGSSNPLFVDGDNANFRLQSSSPSLDTGTSSGAPSDSIGFDSGALLKTTSNQPVSWYRYAPNLSYISGKGEVASLFSPVSRPQGNGFDQGAYEAAGSGTPSGGSNLLANGELDNGTSAWWSWTDSTASGSVSVTGNAGLSGNNALLLDVTNGSDADWKLQAGQNGLTVQAGTTYTLSFKAKSSSNRSIAVQLQQGNSPYTNYLNETVNLTTSAQTFNYTFVPSTSDSATNLKFLFGGNSNDVYVDALSLTAGSGAVNLITNGDFESGNTNGWTSWGGTQQASASSKYEGNYGLYSAGNGIAQTVTGLSPNTTYTLSAHALASSGYINIGAKDYGGTEIVRQITSSTWGAIPVITFTTGSSNTSVLIYVWAPSANSGSIDNVKLIRQ